MGEDRARRDEPTDDGPPLRILWYWPHPHRDESELARGVIAPGDALTVECLTTFRGEALHGPFGAYRVVRDLPDVDHRRRSSWRRILDRGTVHLRRVRQRAALVRHGRFDVVHVQTATLLDAVALPLLRRRTVVVVVVHDVRPHRSRLPEPIERALLTRVYRSADQLVVYHRSVADLLVERHRLDPGRVTVVHHPLPTTVAPPDERPSAHDTPLQVLSFGSLRVDKGLPVLLDAFAQLDPGVAHLTIAGAGDLDLERRAREAGCDGDVTAEIGFVAPERKAELFATTDVVVLPYLDSFTSQSGVLFDAYAHGRPLVVSDVGAIGPSVRDDATGWVVASNDAGALATALRAATDPLARALTADHVRAVAREHEPRAVGAELRRAYALAVTRRRRSDE